MHPRLVFPTVIAAMAALVGVAAIATAPTSPTQTVNAQQATPTVITDSGGVAPLAVVPVLPAVARVAAPAGNGTPATVLPPVDDTTTTTVWVPQCGAPTDGPSDDDRYCDEHGNPTTTHAPPGDDGTPVHDFRVEYTEERTCRMTVTAESQEAAEALIRSGVFSCQDQIGGPTLAGIDSVVPQ